MSDYKDDGRSFLDVANAPASAASTEAASDEVGEKVTADENQLLKPVDYQITETSFGSWRRFMGADQKLFEEFTSHKRFLGLPLLHYTKGRSPETGKSVTAKGIIAIGRFAIGLVAIGQVSGGLIAVGQLGLGVLFGLGQATSGVVAIGQLALGGAFALGQFATAYAVIGQFGCGEYVLAQVGFGTHVLDTTNADPAVIPFFKQFLP